MRTRAALVVLVSVASVCVLAIAAMWVSGAIFLLSLKRNPAVVRPFSIVSYWQAYRGEPLLAKRLHGSSLLAGLLCFAGVPALVMAARRRRRPLHGDARFARREEVVRAGLLGDSGILLGKLGEQFLLLDGQQFVLLCAPTRSGKGVGCVI